MLTKLSMKPSKLQYYLSRLFM